MSKLEDWAYDGETRFYKSMTSTDDKSSFAFVNKGHADCKIQGALHLLKIAEEWCNEPMSFASDTEVSGQCENADALLKYLRDYCGVKDE